MTKKAYPTDVFEQGQSASVAWSQINEELTFGDLSLAALNADLQEVAPLLTRMNQLETQFIEARNERDALYESIWDKVKRARASVKGIYGDDSNEYEMLGGTRLSERKTARRKVSKTE